MSRVDRFEDIPRPKLEQYTSQDRFRDRWKTIHIVSTVFLVSPWVYLALLATGQIPPAQGDCSRAAVQWVTLWVVSLLTLVPAVFFVRRFLGAAQAAGGFVQAAVQGQTAVIFAAAFGQSITIYALVGPVVCMPMSLAYALWGFGFVVLVALVLYARSKAREAMILALARQEEQQ